jgi:hypothetical protein
MGCDILCTVLLDLHYLTEYTKYYSSNFLFYICWLHSHKILIFFRDFFLLFSPASQKPNKLQTSYLLSKNDTLRFTAIYWDTKQRNKLRGCRSSSMQFEIRYYMDLSGGLHAQAPVRLNGRGCDVYWVGGWVNIIPDWGKNCFPLQFWGQPKRLFSTRCSFPRVAAVYSQNCLIIHTKLPGNTHSQGCCRL